MKLFILNPIDVKDGSDWDPWYDKMFTVVVRAKDEKIAREIAESERGSEPVGVWLDNKKTTCTQLKGNGRAGVIIRDVHWA